MPMPLRVLLAAAAIQSVAWAVVTPPLVGPDETAHFAYAQYLGESGKKPAYESGTGTMSTEAGSAMFDLNLWATVGVGSARPFWSDLDVRDWRRHEETLPAAARGNASGPNPVAKNPPLYYAYQVVPYRAARGLPVLDRVFVMRLANVALFLATVGLSWLVAAELSASLLTRTVATACVALHPLGAYLAGIVNPDTMLATWWAAFLLAAVRLLVRGPTRWRVAVLFLVLAGGLLTHGRALPLAFAAPVAIGLAWWRHRPPVARWVKVAVAAAAVFVVAGVVFEVSAGEGGIYGGELRLEQLKPAQFASFVWQFYLPKLPFMDARLGPNYGFRQMYVEQYLGTWGALDVRLAGDTYRVLQLAVAAGLGALGVALVARRRLLAAQWDVLVLLAFLVAVGVLFLHVVSYRTLVGGVPDPLIVGRYLMGLTPVAGLAVAFSVRAAGRRAPYAAAGVLGLLVLLQLGGLGASLARFYG